MTAPRSGVDRVEISTVVYLPAEEVYDFLLDFPRYARYSEYLERVRGDGDGSPGTRYFLTFSWWKLSYTAHSRVTDVTPPFEIAWEITRDLDASGHWQVEAIDPPDDRDHASRVKLRVEFWPSSADSDTLDLPRFVSMDWVIEKTKPIIKQEAERVVERIVADLEGHRRNVDLEIHTTPDSV